ncbi:hypothetical protein [Gorillibacterium sp. sgz5001074]|uniref:hypothetical protein n=1 Tax=Gorillibacterium sp. sgz5001074 TaxID=3446695 RepID=UPI003F671EF5
MADITLIPLSAKLSDVVLKRYIESFLDPERMSFPTYLMLEKLRRNKGYRNSGFKFWDYLDDKPRMRPYIISEATFRSYSHKLSDLLVYWDCTYMEPPSAFPSGNRVCAVQFGEIVRNLDLCPPTLYLFDRDFKWTLIRTDEPQNELGWNCLQIGEIGGPPARKPVPAPGPSGEAPTTRLFPLQQAQRF